MTPPGNSVSTELVQVVSPRTGEIIPLDARTDVLAGFLLDVREMESMLREAKREVTREILNRCDRQASWTLHLEGGLKVTGQSPSPSEEWDGPALREALLDHVDAGRLSIEAVDAAVETVVSYRVRKSGVAALRKLGGPVADTVNQLCQQTEKERRVSVTRAA